MLDHFVGGVEGAAADDVGGAVAFDGDGVFADVFEPAGREVNSEGLFCRNRWKEYLHVFERAGA